MSGNARKDVLGGKYVITIIIGPNDALTYNVHKSVSKSFKSLCCISCCTSIAELSLVLSVEFILYYLYPGSFKLALFLRPLLFKRNI